ncbi:MAG: flavodoxin domain-containing protein [Oscillospiraceae bacterium]|nr:flavodoxin domain-containing protein [Oscillospiraceae bacterium]
MKTIIFYATKYGASREIAQRISAKLPDSVICDLKENQTPPFDGFDCIIIGGSLYAGMLRKEAKIFAKENADFLSGKKFGLFLSGMTEKEEQYPDFFKLNFPENVLKNAKTTAFLGGIYDPSKAKGLDKFIYRVAAKQTEFKSTISDKKIEKFVKEIQNDI